MTINWLLSTVGRRTYIADYIRAASPPGSRIIGTGSTLYTEGFGSCDVARILPSIDDPGYLDSVLDVCRDERVQAMITLSDHDVMAVATIRSALSEMGVACFFADPAGAETYGNKWETYRASLECGVDMPFTVSGLEQAKDIGYPMVVKPRRGSASVGIAYPNDEADLVEAWAACEDPIGQEFSGGRLLNVEVCSDADGRVLGACAWAKHETRYAGETYRSTTIDHPEAISAAVRLLEHRPVPGPVDLDMVETADGVKIYEVNTRFGGGYPVSQLAGADFPALMVASLEPGYVPERLDNYERGVEMMKKIVPFRYYSEDPTLARLDSSS